MIAMWKEISETIKVKYHHFLADFDTHPQRYFMRLLFVFLVSLVITITMFVFPKNIREAQVESLVYNANQLSDFPTQLIPELNRLPLANIKKLEEELGKETQTTSTNTQLGTDLKTGSKKE